MPRISDPPFAVKLGAAITARRSWLEISMADLAQRMGISRVQMGKYENGTNIPDAVVLVRLCTALGTSPNDLLNHGTPQASQAHLDEMSSLLADAEIGRVIELLKPMTGKERHHARKIVELCRQNGSGT